MLTDKQIEQRMIEIRRRWFADRLRQQHDATKLELKQLTYQLLRSPSHSPAKPILSGIPASTSFRELTRREKQLTKKRRQLETQIQDSRQQSISLLCKFKAEVTLLYRSKKSQMTAADLLQSKKLQDQLLGLIATLYNKGDSHEQARIKDSLFAVREYIIDFIDKKVALLKKHPTLMKAYGEFATYVVFDYLRKLDLERTEQTQPVPETMDPEMLAQLKKTHPYVIFHQKRSQPDMTLLRIFGKKKYLSIRPEKSRRLHQSPSIL